MTPSQAGQLQYAIHLARHAIFVDSALRPAWLLLSRCCIKLGHLEQALIILNLVPHPPHLLLMPDYQVGYRVHSAKS